MPLTIKWILFCIANYLFLFVHVFSLNISSRFIIEEMPSGESHSFITPLLISHIVIILNSVFNLNVFHLYFPDKPLRKGKENNYLIAAILSAIALSISVVYFILSIIALSDYNGEGPPVTNVSLIFILYVVTGIFILVNQFEARKILQKKRLEEEEAGADIEL